MCKSKPTCKSVHSVETCESSHPHPFLGATKSSTQGDSVPRWTVELTLCDTSVKFTIDTGADLSVIPKSTYDSLLNAPPLDTPSTTLTGPAGRPLPLVGQFQGFTAYRGTQYNFPVYVLDAPGSSNLLSRDVSTRMGLVQRLNVGSTSAPTGPPIGCMTGAPVSILLNKDAVPYNCVTARRVPLPLHEKVRDKLKRMTTGSSKKSLNRPTGAPPWFQ